jgi:hypothetical protein
VLSMASNSSPLHISQSSSGVLPTKSSTDERMDVGDSDSSREGSGSIDQIGQKYFKALQRTNLGPNVDKW